MTTHTASEIEAQTAEATLLTTEDVSEEFIECWNCGGTGVVGDVPCWNCFDAKEGVGTGVVARGASAALPLPNWKSALDKMGELGHYRRKYTHARSLGGTKAREEIYKKTRALATKLDDLGVDQDTAARAYGLSRAQFWNILNYRAGERPEANVVPPAIRALSAEDRAWLRRHGLRGL